MDADLLTRHAPPFFILKNILLNNVKNPALSLADAGFMEK